LIQIDPVEVGLRLTLRIHELAKILGATSQRESSQRRNEEKIGKALQTRASDIPSLILSTGLVPALTMYMSKTDPVVYKNIYQWLVGKLNSNDIAKMDRRVLKDLIDELSKEGKGYSAMLALISCALTELFSDDFNKDRMSDIGELAKSLLDVREKGKELVIQNGLLPLLLEVKKLSKALFS